jgi:hypothetical protein
MIIIRKLSNNMLFHRPFIQPENFRSIGINTFTIYFITSRKDLFHCISPPKRSSYRYLIAKLACLFSFLLKFHLLKTEILLCKVVSVKLSLFWSIRF